jgi:drug/metabolite transporter (DMT)-like permease
MSIAIALGMASALLYGTSDFISHFANKASGVLRTMLYGELFLAVILTGLLFFTSRIPTPSAVTWAVLVVSDFSILLATACLYRALAVGNLSIVPPVSACYGAVAALIAIAAGEKVRPLALGGLILAVAGGVAAAAPSGQSEKSSAEGPTGAFLAAASAVLYGCGFWVQGRFSVPALGLLIPIWSYYALGSLTVLLVAVVTRRNVRPPTLLEAPAMCATAMLAVAGYGALVRGQATGQVAIVTALSSVASAVTVLLARVFLRQPVALHGWLGLGAVIVGLAILRIN